MLVETASSAPVRFGTFELDLRTGELRSNGSTVRLQPQPAKVLALLVSRAGEVVIREDLKKHVWGSETFVDFDKGLTFAIGQIRTALGDDPDHARFVETLPKRGYRFIALLSEPPVLPSSPVPSSSSGVQNNSLRYGVALAATVALVLAFG